ncbi:hypothetical protein ATO6_07590 [Oceanicola sp. 22II-s10i]|uniref:hypothetical protein n=1 Tax=Oceanicola sp. 22II-s10i TaxID=1317116 RepID=UPI000B529332|nr:hypothetical protein [Oceanicola sp. 22II-s10i]OWU86631.1 hypothetical protein ATO6_07590 [Oceanicola sp. 22II-s10i]
MILRGGILAAILTLAPPGAAVSQTLPEVMRDVDAALAAQPEDARRTIVEIGRALPAGTPPDVLAYPALRLAELFYRHGAIDRAEGMAGQAAHLLDTAATRDHPFRIRALILQGIALVRLQRPADALATLRPAVEKAAEMPDLARDFRRGLYHLAVAATRTRAPDATGLRGAYWQTRQESDGITDADMLKLEIEALSLDLSVSDPDITDLLERSRILIKVALATDHLTAENMALFRALHGRILYRAEAYDEAAEVLETLRETAIAEGRYDADYADMADLLARVFARRGDMAGGARILAEAEERLTTADIPDRDRARLIATRGRFADALDRTAEAQDHYRRAYATARNSLPRSDRMVTQIAALIDVDAPGMAAFALAPELRPVAAEALLDPGGEAVLRTVMSGGQGNLIMAFDALSKGAPDPMIAASRAYFEALLGQTDSALQSVEFARRMARAGMGGTLSDTDPFLDLIAVTAVSFGSSRPATEVAGERARLTAALPGLSPDTALLARALEITARVDLTGDTGAATRALIAEWIALWQRLPSPSASADFAAALIAPSLYDDMPFDAAEAILAPVRARNRAPGGLQLLADQMRFDMLSETPDQTGIEDRLSERASLALTISGVLPRDHPWNMWNFSNVSSQLSTLGRFAEARDWLAEAIRLLRERDNSPADLEAMFLNRLATITGNMGDDRGAATYARQAYDMIDPMTARPWAAHQVILSYAIEQPGTDDLLAGADIIRGWLDRPDFMARLSPDDALYMRYIHAHLRAMYAQPDAALATIADYRAILPDDGQDRRDELAALSMLEAEAHGISGRFPQSWHSITEAVDTDRAWRQDTYGPLADATGQFTTDAMRSLEAEIGWLYAQSLPD